MAESSLNLRRPSTRPPQTATQMRIEQLMDAGDYAAAAQIARIGQRQ